MKSGRSTCRRQTRSRRGQPDALTREIREELGCAVIGLRGYDSQPAGTRVVISCYFGDLDGHPVPMAEIAEVGWFSHSEYTAMPETAPAAMQILHDLHGRNLIA
jgi:8-oxo-dGTP diphosphatase